MSVIDVFLLGREVNKKPPKDQIYLHSSLLLCLPNFCINDKNIPIVINSRELRSSRERFVGCHALRGQTTKSVRE